LIGRALWAVVLGLVGVVGVCLLLGRRVGEG